MAYFVTGATGFIGRHVVQELLANRDGDVFVLVRAASRGRAERLIEQWGHPDRVTMVVGDLEEAALGVAQSWVEDHRGSIDHFFHLAGVCRATASAAQDLGLGVGGTRNALELAADLDAGVFHQLSSIAASGDYRGFWDETMFDVGQRLPSAYHQTVFDSEKAVREESAVPWRVYRTSIVIGHSRTGEVDGLVGPYYYFPVLKLVRDHVPSWTPLVGVDVGDTNVVPVDFVARAIDHLGHLAGHDGEAFHLISPQPQRTVDVIDGFAAAAGAPRLAAVVDRSLTRLVPTGLLPEALRPGTLLRGALRTPPAKLVAPILGPILDATLGRLGLPPEALQHIGFPTAYGARMTEQALAGSGISVPPLDTYAAAVWAFWEEQLDDPVPGAVHH